MAVKLLFPTPIFLRHFLDPQLSPEDGFGIEYVKTLKKEIDWMRKQDPKGRRISNAYTGWQSNDGVDRNPIFQKCMNRIQRFIEQEVCLYYGTNSKVHMGNSWANINDSGAWNKPHLHNGCWHSGVFYIHADGQEGHIDFIDTQPKVVGNMPLGIRSESSHAMEPKAGLCVLFPSAAMHMVHPNFSEKDRYSISFNFDLQDYHANDEEICEYHDKHRRNENLFDLDDKGTLLINDIS